MNGQIVRNENMYARSIKLLVEKFSVVATILPVPLMAVVVKLPAAPPPITTLPDVKPSTCMFARLAVLPDTITFFQVAMFVVLFYYKYMSY